MRPGQGLQQQPNRSSNANLTVETLLQSVLDHAPLILFAADRQGRFTVGRGSGLALLGLEPDQLVGQSAFEIFSGMPAIIADIRRAFGGETFRADVPLAGRVFECVYTPMFESDGTTVAGITGVAHDVTSRARAHAQLQDQAVTLAQQAALLNLAHDAIIVWELQSGAIRFWNRGAEQLYGWTSAEVLGRTPGDVLRTVFPCPLAEINTQLIRTHHWEGQLEHTRKDGTSAVVASRWALQFDSDGRPDAVLGINTDITEQTRAEEELRESEARKSAILSGALDAIISVDDAGLITEFNPAAEQMFGYAATTVLGRDIADVIIPERFRTALRGGPNSLSRRRAFIGRRVETIAARADGSEFPSELAITEFQAGDRPAFTCYLRDISDRRRSEAALAYQARHDALTNLPNRAQLRERLDSTLGSVRKGDAAVSLLLLDLDHFKDVNDTLGHAVGDDVLQQVAVRLREQLRPEDTIARLGGDEFAVVLPDASLSNAEHVASRLRLALECPIEVGHMRLSIGASIGIAFAPDHGADAATLLRRADIAMYAAKRSGHGTTSYCPELDRDAVDRPAFTAELREGIEAGQLVLHYQPKVVLESGAPLGVEALVRWQHPRRGLLGPDQFIPLAEQTGLIQPLTEWVLRTARTQQAAWHADGLNVDMAVNLSVRSLYDPDLLELLRELMFAYSTGDCQFEVELTESTLMSDPNRARAVVDGLRSLGVRVSVDDFGTGYSSLAYLKRLPLDEIKIDRCFVHDMATDTRDQAVVKAIVDLSHTLGMRVVAEGVEDAQSMDMLAQMGCDMVQGYYLARPLPPETLVAWIAERAAADGDDAWQIAA